MDPVTLIAFGSVVLKFLLDFAAIMLIAWLALEVCKEVCSYLRGKEAGGRCLVQASGN